MSDSPSSSPHPATAADHLDRRARAGRAIRDIGHAVIGHQVDDALLDYLLKIVEATRPRYARITARWYVRGGIYTNVVAEHRKKGRKPQPVVTLPAHGAESGLLG